MLRPATVADVGRVGAILSEFVDTTDWMPRVHSRAQDIAHAEAMIERGWVQVAERDGAVAAFVACEGAALNALYVARAFRGAGLGASVLEALKRDRARLELWTFQANTGAQRFYVRHGFAEVARTQGAANDEGLPDIQYKWQREAA